MSQKYTPHFKKYVQYTLQQNDGDVYRTHLQTGVPVRTIYDWRRAWQTTAAQPNPHPHTPHADSTAKTKSTAAQPNPHPHTPHNDSAAQKTSAAATATDIYNMFGDNPDNIDYSGIRKQYLDKIASLTAQLPDLSPRDTLHVIKTVKHMLDQIDRLNPIIFPNEPEHILITYMDKTSGIVSDRPPWQWDEREYDNPKTIHTKDDLPAAPPNPLHDDPD